MIKTVKYLVVILAVAFASIANSQTADRKWGIGLSGGAEQYSGDFGNGFYKFDQAFYGFGGLSISRYLTPHFDVELNGTYGDIGHVENKTNYFLHRGFQVNVNAKYNFLKEEAKLRPFVFLGTGYMSSVNKRTGVKHSAFEIPSYGLGLTYKVSPIVSLVLKETFMYTSGDDIDMTVNGPNDAYLQQSIGVVFNLGKAKDTDGDGITDKDDLCPEAAGLLELGGCPDADKDGIADKDDKCPNVAGLKKFNGCPDTDGDGIIDKLDNCPKVAGLEKFNGCPDTDGDGIQDSKDACPKVKGLAKFNGCPDTDGDGVADKDDACPKVKGLAKFKGCPDTDGDGVQDKYDRCPKVAGIASNKGCPAVKEEVTKVLEKALHGIKFKSGKDIITRASYPILDNVVTIMKENSTYKLKIEGHTDSQGRDDLNMKLSQNRAFAVARYLSDKGIAASRLSSEGFGETKPMADNKTSKGRALNRRVELTVKF